MAWLGKERGLGPEVMLLARGDGLMVSGPSSAIDHLAESVRHLGIRAKHLATRATSEVGQVARRTRADKPELPSSSAGELGIGDEP